MYRRSFNPAVNPSRSRSPANEYGFNRGYQQGEEGQETGSMRNPYDMGDDDFRDEDELYLAQDFDQRDTDRYQDLVPRMARGEHYGKGPKNWRPSDLRIKEEVCEALYLHDDIDASEIEVDVKEGLVSLNGFVPDRRSKRLAEDIADELTGVVDVQNLLAVRVSAPAKDTGPAQNDWSYPVER